MAHPLHRAIAASLLIAGCNKAEPEHQAAPPQGLNALVARIPAGSLVSGFKHGKLRKNVDVAGFSISKRPITVAQYGACVDAGACNAPAPECARSNEASKDAALCADYEGARAYCAWSEGRLPTLSEWLLAARGQDPQRFSWGDRAPTCEDHPLARDSSRRRGSSTLLTRSSNEEQTECNEPLSQRFRVGQHGAGASPHGLEDVLIARGELIGGTPGSHFAACASSSRGCIVHGLIPGAIDAVKPTNDAPVSSLEQAYAFRCVWSKEGS